MAHEFMQDYESLQLAKDATWSDAQASYRKLVNRWHPDRFAQRPRELDHAQKKFIELTKCFNNLRNFHRINDRLPFEQLSPIANESATPKARQKIEPVDGLEPDLTILNNGKANDASGLFSKIKPFAWTAVAGALIIGALTALYVMDTKARKHNMDKAREATDQSVPSEFSPKSADIKKRNNRGAIINNTARGQLGDQLMQDVFR